MNRFLSRLLTPVTGRKTHTPRQPRPTRLGLECLDAREMPSVSPMAVANDPAMLADTAVGTPATTMFNGHQVIAWAGTHSAHHLNVLVKDVGEVALGDTSPTGVARAAQSGRLDMAWAGRAAGN